MKKILFVFMLCAGIIFTTSIYNQVLATPQYDEQDCDDDNEDNNSGCNHSLKGECDWGDYKAKGNWCS